MAVKIYCLKDPRTNEIRYIGKTTQMLNSRLSSHVSKDRGNQNHTWCWIKSLKDLGLRPIIELIEEVDDSIWDVREKYYISLYENLTNHSIGGELGTLGCKWSVEDKTISRESKGTNILVFDLDLNLVEELNSIVEFTEKYNVASQNVIRRIDKGLPIRNRLVYRKNSFKKAELKSNRLLNNPVLVYDLQGNLLYEFTNTIEASKYLELDNSTISKLIKSGNPHKRRKLTFKNKYYGC